MILGLGLDSLTSLSFSIPLSIRAANFSGESFFHFRLDLTIVVYVTAVIVYL